MNEVYVIAGGEWLRNNLNAIAAFMGTRTWDSIEKIALTLSVLAVAVMWVQRHNVMDLLGWVSGELITGRRQLQEGMVFTPGSTVIVDQGEKLSLKETLTLLDGAARHNVQVLITDSGQRTGTGSALMAMKDAGVNTYRWQGGEQRPATIISEPDRNVRYDRLAGDFAASVKAGEESVAQVSGVREQAILTQAIRSELKTQGVLGHPEVTMTALSPVWLDSRSRYLRDMYRPGMVMEQWNPETRSHDRYVIDRVTAQS
ncbi:hypothetical protein NX036_23845, partial [Escherichia coli]|nr:hypothetical protein [Escherichia coli]